MSRRRFWKALVRPREGRQLPPELKPRRVGVLAGQLSDGVRDPAFRRLLQRIDQAPIHHGNRIELFFGGSAAFDAMLQAIRGAQHEVLLQSYILKDDQIGDALAAAMEAATARGVTVRLLADAFGSSRTRLDYWKRLKRAGVKARLINNLMPTLWYGKAYRDHRKILVVDRSVAFTGGMNLGEEYAGTDQKVVWRDTHVRIEGAAAWEMAIVFAEGWGWSGGAPFEFDPTPATSAGDGGDVLVLDSRPLRGHQETASAVAATIAAARHTAWITNAYFAPRPFTVEQLAHAAQRGVDVRLLLPGPTDVPIVRHSGHGYFEALLLAGIRVFEYQPRVLHAKTLVVDRYASMVGSTNIDFRSFHFNAECNALMLDDAVGTRLAQQFEHDLADANEITLSAWLRRPRLHRMGDALAKRLAFLL